MVLKREKSFAGGYKFKTFAGNPLPKVEEAPLPPKVIIPLQHGKEEAVQSTVKIGDQVYAGQVIGTGYTFSSPVHSSINGKILAFTSLKWQGKERAVVVIQSDGTKNFIKLEIDCSDFERRSPEEIAKALYAAGITSLGKSGIPTKYNTSTIDPSAVNNIIVNATESEPYYFSNKIFLGSEDKINKFIIGLKILRIALHKVMVHVCINKNDKKLVQELAEKTKELDWLEVHPTENKFPAGHDEILVEMVLRRRIPYGATAINVGVVVLDPQAVFQAYEAVIEAKPLIERTIALSGSAFAENIYVKVRIGTPLSEIIEPRLKKGIQTRLIFGSIMHGDILADLSLPVIKSSFQVIALDESLEDEFLAFLRPGLRVESYTRTFLSALFPEFKREVNARIHGELRPCIQCNYCAEVCPRPLYPHLLSKCVKRGFIEEAENYEILACIECGLCSYVCPAKIHLLADIKKGKQEVYIKEKGIV